MATSAAGPHHAGSILNRYLPILHWLPAYHRSWLRPDIIAGLTVWALVVPQAIAYAGIAGLSPEAGLFTTFAGLLGYVVFATSRQLVVSPTSSTAAISASLIAGLAISDPAHYWEAASTLAILCGVIFILLGLAGAGFVSQFIATAVQTGMMFGLGMTIIIGQLPKILGIPGTEGTFFEQLRDVGKHIGDTSG